MQVDTRALYIGENDARFLFEQLGPSLGIWRAAEIAVLREQPYTPPILDLGCGDGFVSALVFQRVDIGIDPDQHGLKRAEARGLFNRLIPAPMEEAGLPPESVSTIVSNSVLEHLPRIDDALLAAARVLKPGGRLISTSPSEGFTRSLLIPSSRYRARRNRFYEHFNLWTVEQWAEHLERAGFAVDLVRPYLRPGLVRAWDFLELIQMPHFGRRRVFGMVWKNLPPRVMAYLARRAARTDLSSPSPGGGRLIVARKK